jgi:hypothetical protein
MSNDSAVSTHCLRHESVSLLLSNNPSLLDLMFAKDRRRLRWPSHAIVSEAGHLGAAERSLAKIGLDLWNGSGRARLSDALNLGTDFQRESFILAMSHRFFANDGSCHCRICRQRDEHFLQSIPQF